MTQCGHSQSVIGRPWITQSFTAPYRIVVRPVMDIETARRLVEHVTMNGGRFFTQCAK